MATSTHCPVVRQSYASSVLDVAGQGRTVLVLARRIGRFMDNGGLDTVQGYEIRDCLIWIGETHRVDIARQSPDGLCRPAERVPRNLIDAPAVEINVNADP